MLDGLHTQDGPATAAAMGARHGLLQLMQSTAHLLKAPALLAAVQQELAGDGAVPAPAPAAPAAPSVASSSTHPSAATASTAAAPAAPALEQPAGAAVGVHLPAAELQASPGAADSSCARPSSFASRRKLAGPVSSGSVSESCSSDYESSSEEEGGGVGPSSADGDVTARQPAAAPVRQRPVLPRLVIPGLAPRGGAEASKDTGSLQVKEGYHSPLATARKHAAASRPGSARVPGLALLSPGLPAAEIAASPCGIPARSPGAAPAAATPGGGPPHSPSLSPNVVKHLESIGSRLAAAIAEQAADPAAAAGVLQAS